MGEKNMNVIAFLLKCTHPMFKTKGKPSSHRTFMFWLLCAHILVHVDLVSLSRELADTESLKIQEACKVALCLYFNQTSSIVKRASLTSYKITVSSVL